MRSSQFFLRSALILFIFATSILSQPIKAAPAPALTLVWQTKFEGDAVIVSPGDIAIDTAGNVFVTTQAASLVKKFDAKGNFVTQWGGSGKGEGKFSLSLGIAVDGDNNVYVADFYNKLIQKFDNDGKFLMQWATEPSTSPAFLAIDAEGNLYADQFPPHDEHFILKYDGSGKLLGEWGNKDDMFSGRIEDIAVDRSGNLYIADPLKHRVQKLDPDGKLVATFGGKSSKDGNGLFMGPFGIAIDGDNNIYVLDVNFLQKLDAQGDFIAQWTTKGGDLDKASNLMIDADGNLYMFAKAEVTAANGSKVSVFVLKKFSQA